MYLLYLTVYYLLSIQHSTTSYVLLAANIEDFRSLAKKFVPESFADSIFAVGAGPESHENTKYAIANTYSDESHTAEQSQEEQENVKAPVNLRSRVSARHRKARTSTTPNFDIDDLVERVKARLQKEMTLFATSVSQAITSDKEVYTTKKPEDKVIYESSDDVMPIKPHTVKRPQVRYVKQSRIDAESKKLDRDVKHESIVQYNTPHTKSIPQSKYSDEESKVLPHPKPVSRPERFKKQRLNKDHVQHEKKIHIPKKTTKLASADATTDADAVAVTEDKFFQGFDLGKGKDSYEDYEIPKKDDSYEEPVPSKHIKHMNPGVDEKRARNHTVENEDVFDIFSDADDTHYNNKKIPDSIDEEEITNDYKSKNDEEAGTPTIIKNVKKVPIIKEPQKTPAILPLPKETKKIANKPVLPYAEQIVRLTENEYGTQATTADAINTPAASVSIEESDNAGPFYKEVAFNVTKTTRAQGKRTKKPQKAGTIIPKRDFYKLSSPNYLGKLPAVVDKYEFDEPIPEKDREPEHLKPVGNPPASINGKVKLL